jgi:hypothetical protein
MKYSGEAKERRRSLCPVTNKIIIFSRNSYLQEYVTDLQKPLTSPVFPFIRPVPEVLSFF